MRKSKIEIVRTDAGYHVRLVASNGEPLATTEVYTRKETAENAILSMARVFGADVWHGEVSPGDFECRNIDRMPHLDLNVVYVDERADG